MPGGSSAALDRAVVGIRGVGGDRVGVGFLVTEDLVLTCAHVVDAVSGRHATGISAASVQVVVDLPLVSAARTEEGQRRTTRAALVYRQPSEPDGGGDIAVLRLAQRLPQSQPVRMVETRDVWGHPMRTFGFPAGREFGVWHSGRLLGRQAAGWVQAQLAEPTGYRIEQGFSGAPVWDDELDGVVGMVVAAESAGTPAGYLIPTETLLAAWPELRSHALAPCPYRGLAPFREVDEDVFHGRRQETGELVELVRQQPIVTVVGPSGCGKSSLVFAGVLPPVRTGGEVAVAAFRPSGGSRPFAALAAALLPLLEPELTETSRLADVPVLAETIATQGLGDLVPRVLQRTGTSRLLVVLDQGEELLAQDADQVDLLAGHLLGGTAPDQLRVLITLRADFLEAALRHPALSPALRRSVYTLGAMTTEQLREVVTEPVADLGGVEFDAGLVERILQDVGTDPGALPLLGLTLTLLWERQSAGQLTHEAYDELGRVPGSLARYAEEVWRQSIPDEDQPRARRLLTQLVRVPPVGAATRRVATADDLGEPGWRLAQRLATTRLLVTGRDPQQRETVELAHEALISEWARLHGWIESDREFRAWQEALRDDLARWERTGRDPDLLLRGPTLAAAQQWEAERQTELPSAEREFIDSSRARQRREVRRWRMVTAVLLVLTLAAGVLTAVTINANSEISAALATANARTLGEDAIAQSPINTDRANQLALAAYASDPNSPQARSALARQFVTTISATSVLSNVTDTPIDALRSSADGDVLLVPRRDGVTVVRGLSGDTPDITTLPGAVPGATYFLSPDGRWIAAVDPRGGLRRWDLRRLGEPRVLARNGAAAPGPAIAAFSPDSRRLVRLVGQQLQLWDVASGTPLPHRLGPLTDPNLTQVWLTRNRDLVLLVSEVTADVAANDQETTTRIVTRDLTTGAQVRTASGFLAVAHHGGTVVSCAEHELVTSSSITGAETRRISLAPGNCTYPGVDLSADGDFVMLASGDTLTTEAGTLDQRTLYRLSNGEPMQVKTPPLAEDTDAQVTTPLRRGGTFAVISSKQSASQLVVAHGASLLRLTPDPALGLSEYANGPQVLPGGKHLLEFDGDNNLHTLDATTGERIASLTGAFPDTPADQPASFGGLGVDDSGRTLALGVTSPEYAILRYSLPQLRPLARFTPPRPSGITLPYPELLGFASAQVGDKTVIAFAGEVTVWSADGAMEGAPTPVPGAADAAEPHLENWWVLPRPGHPDEVALVSEDGTVHLWSLTRRAPTGVLIRTKATTQGFGEVLAFDPRGERLVSLTKDGVFQFWDADTGGRVGRPIPAGIGTKAIVGVTGDGLITEAQAQDGAVVSFWHPDGPPAGSLPIRVSEVLSVQAVKLAGDDRLSISLSGHSPLDIPTNPRAWFEHLCRIQNRPFTDAERAALPPQTDTDLPCENR